MKRTIAPDLDIYPPFNGFPREGLLFLKRLKKNNNRPWFQKHKTEYEEFVRFPMQCLVASLAERMSDDSPEIEFNPKHSIFRIYRDVRFSKNKAPYKTNIAAVFSLRGRKGVGETPGLYVGIEPGEVFLGGGVYMPTSEQLKAFRKAIMKNPDEFLAVVENKTFKKEFGGIWGERLTRPPIGFPKDHPLIEHLKLKQFYVGKVRGETACLKPRFLEEVIDAFKKTMPLVRWLARAIGM
jgi:uncharacterized protein (TIGR02453 family)